MSAFYQKAQKRLIDNRRNCSIHQHLEEDVIIQLMTEALKNRFEPFELPKNFVIKETLLTKNELQDLLIDLDCPSTVYSLIGGKFNNFRVICEKTQG